MASSPAAVFASLGRLNSPPSRRTRSEVIHGPWRRHPLHRFASSHVCWPATAFVAPTGPVRCCSFLVARAQSDSPEAVKRVPSFGVEVFGRPLTYDPRTDPIVRVTMRELRLRLAAY